MSIQARLLAEGRLPAMETVLYTVPPATKTRLTSIIAYNTAGALETVLFLIRANATSRVIGRAMLLISETAKFLDNSVKTPVMEAGDTLRGFSTTANIVDYYISGEEET